MLFVALSNSDVNVFQASWVQLYSVANKLLDISMMEDSFRQAAFKWWTGAAVRVVILLP